MGDVHDGVESCAGGGDFEERVVTGMEGVGVEGVRG